MAAVLSPVLVGTTQTKAAGVINSGGFVYTYLAGTTTAAATYTDNTLGTPNANPIVLNSYGRLPAEIWWSSGTYFKFIIKDSAGNTIDTLDNLVGINDVAASAPSEWTALALTPTYVSATSFTVPGNQTTTLQPGRRIKTTNTAGTVYSTITSSTFSTVTTLVVENDSGVIDSGISAVSYSILSATNTAVPATTGPRKCDGRLTLTSGTAVTTGDVTAAGTIYFTPYKGNQIDLYDTVSSKWITHTYAEASLPTSAGANWGTASTMYDVFGFMTGAVFTLEAVAWTNDTTRATALATQDGVLVKTGTLSKRYLGSFRTTTVANQTEDSAAKRYVWNMYNRVPRKMRNTDSTATWNYTTATFRIANGATAPSNCLDFIIGVSEDEVRATALHSAANTSAAIGLSTAIGLDGATRSADCLNQQISSSGANQITGMSAEYHGYPGIGRHYLSWLEYSAASGTTTWRGSNATPIDINGISGTIFA